MFYHNLIAVLWYLRLSEPQPHTAHGAGVLKYFVIISISASTSYFWAFLYISHLTGLMLSFSSFFLGQPPSFSISYYFIFLQICWRYSNICHPLQFLFIFSPSITKVTNPGCLFDNLICRLLKNTSKFVESGMQVLANLLYIWK